MLCASLHCPFNLPSPVYPCVPLCTPVYPCVPLCTPMYKGQKMGRIFIPYPKPAIASPLALVVFVEKRRRRLCACVTSVWMKVAPARGR
jgi:hypothetical protein